MLRQAALAARHTDAPSSARLTLGQREELEREKTLLQNQLDRLADEWVEGVSRRDGQIDIGGYTRISSSLERKLSVIDTRLKNDKIAGTVENELAVLGERDRVRTFLEIMTVETPDDPLLRQLRARIFQRIVQRVIIDDNGEGPITLTIEGHLVPEGAPLAAANPVLACADLLDAYEATKRGELPAAEAKLKKEADLRADFETVSEKPSSETVSKLYGEITSMATTHELERLAESTLSHSGRQSRSGSLPPLGRHESGAHRHRRSRRITVSFGGRSSRGLGCELLTTRRSSPPSRLRAVKPVEGLCGILGWERRNSTRPVQKLVDEGLVLRLNGGSGRKRMTSSSFAEARAVYRVTPEA